MESFLLKRSRGRFKRWQKVSDCSFQQADVVTALLVQQRFFLVEGDALVYLKNAGRVQRRRLVVNLRVVDEITASGVYFTVISGSGNYHLRAESVGVAAQWVAALRRHLAADSIVVPGTPVPPPPNRARQFELNLKRHRCGTCASGCARTRARCGQSPHASQKRTQTKSNRAERRAPPS